MPDDSIIVSLDKGMVTVIDASDAERVLTRRWHAARRGKNWYAATTIKKKQVYLHRFILDAPPGVMLDHADNDGLNNCRRNLRPCNHSQNGANSPNHKIGKSGYRGVSYNPYGYWFARIRTKEKRITLGYFHTQEEAALAYDAAARIIHGEFAVLNFP